MKNNLLVAISIGLSACGTSNPLLGIVMPELTPQQVIELREKINTTIPDNTLSLARNEAASNIENFIINFSCARDDAPAKYTRSLIAPNASINSMLSPRMGMKYHNPNQCLLPQSIDGWNLPARNALKFKSTFISQSSGETKTVFFEMVKQTSGNWLFTKANPYQF